jgi:predicted nucleic-acid-binding Zn-ribbon protein
MKKPLKCLWCESERIEDGKLMAMGGQVVFRPENVKFWTLSEGSVQVMARVCMDCGYIDLYASPKKLGKVVDEL